MRCFISIKIPKEIQKEIERIQENLPEFHGKKIEKENLHLTLKFLGEVDEKKVEEIRKKLREIKYNSFEAEIDSVGFFSENFIRIVWLHLKNCDELQKAVDEKLKDFFEPEKRFMSHLTIARVKSLEDKKKFLEKMKKIKIPKIEFGVNEFYLMKSVLSKEGPKYEIIEEYKLN